MHYQFLPNAAPSDADIVILPIAYEESVCAKEGTKEAPASILQASEQLEYYEEDGAWSPMQYLQVSVCEEIEQYAQIAPFVATLPLKNKLLISLGGEHSITPEITASLLKKRSTILFLDAHADLRESYQGSQTSHATPAHHLLAQGHKLLMVGVRSLFESEAKRVQEDGMIEFYADRELRKESERERLLETLASLEGDVYLSIDMDVFDPALVPGVGTPQPGGIDWHFAVDILEVLIFNAKIELKGVDIVELVPEASNVSQIVAAKLMQKIISFWGKAKGYETKEKKGSQMGVVYE